MKNEITNSRWYTTLRGECIGIVEVTLQDGTKKEYIGIGNGFDLEADERLIVSTGTPFYG